ncbi:MAG: calcium-binding protein [Candidatus Eremiobacterota bacterium]
MERINKDREREERISMEIIVDSKDAEERAMGWYYYLEDRISFPFTAICITEKRKSPLQKGDEVEVVDIAPEDECEHEMFVEIQWDRGRRLAIPLSQVKPIENTDEDTKEAVADWHYWIEQGYEM